MLVIDIFSHMLISLFVALVFRPYLGAAGLAVVLPAGAYLVRAWINADMIVAEKAGFRPPTLVQQRYLDYLDTGQQVFTHPSLLPVAGSLASSRRRLILLTGGVFKELREDDMRQLIAKLAARDRRPIFGWTFHLATGGARLFSSLDRDDPFAGHWRRTLIVAVISGLSVVVTSILIASSISMMMRRPIDISRLVPVFWLPVVYFSARFAWQRANAALVKPGVGSWNKPITLDQAIFLPMSLPAGSDPNINLLRPGLLLAEKRRRTAR